MIALSRFYSFNAPLPHSPAEGEFLTADARKFIHDRWFEIQVRSVLEHAWAEIEHEVVYKSGTMPSPDFTRQFAALAGTLEMLDVQFESLREQQKKLVDSYAAQYQSGHGPKRSFDVASLLGFLRAMRPAADQVQGAIGHESSCVEALRAVGLGTPTSLKRMLRSRRFGAALRSFAASEGIEPGHVSPLAVVVLATAIKKPAVIKHHLPEIISDPGIRHFIASH